MAADGTVAVAADIDDDDFDHAPHDVIERFWALTALADEAHGRLSAAFDRVNEIKSERRHAEVELQALERADQRGELYAIQPGSRGWDERGNQRATRIRDEARLTAAKRRVDQVGERLSKETERHAAASVQWRVASGLVTKARRYLNATRRTTLRSAEPVQPTLKPRESPAAAVERTRAEIASLRHELRNIGKAPGTVAEAKAKARTVIERLVQRGRPDVAPLFERNTEVIRWPTWTFGTDRVNPATGIDGGALVAWLHRDALLAAVDREIEAHGAGLADAIAAEDRTARQRQIEAELMRLAYTEQTLIDRAAAGGQTITPRADADIRAVLMLAPDSPVPPKN